MHFFTRPSFNLELDNVTTQVLGKDGWMHTGDTAVITEAGYGKIVGRMKDMIIRGGENIYPRLNCH